jgi:hypothetical protein
MYFGGKLMAIYQVSTSSWTDLIYANGRKRYKYLALWIDCGARLSYLFGVMVAG